MALSSLFSTQGANPFANAPTNPANPLAGSTAASKALSPNFQTISGQVQSIAPYAANQNYLPPAPQKPSTPVKKTTVNNVDGSSHITEYHAPTTPGLIDNSLGTANPNANFFGAGSAPNLSPQNTQTSTQATAQPTSSYSSANPSTYSGLINNIANQGAQPSAIQNLALGNAKDSYQQYQDIEKQLEASRVAEAGELARIGGLPVGVGDQTGRSQVATTQYGQVQNALASQASALASLYAPSLSGATTAQGQQFSAEQSAAGLSAPSNQFMQVPYNNQLINSQGQAVGGGSIGSLPAGGQDFVNSLAQQVQSGQMTRSDAESRLGAYGQPGLQALNTALGSGFNTNASNASAATTAIGQQISAALPPANQALDALQAAYNGLNSFQQGGTGLGNVPILSGLVQNASLATGLGREAASAYQGALQEARSRIDAALVGSIGVNAAAAQASALLPDNMLPNEIPQKIAAAKQYLQNQLSSYTSSGNQQSNSNAQSNSNSLYSF